LFLAGSHIAHDARVGSRVVMTNLASIAGHSWVGDGALLGAFVGIHQFARVGEMSMIAAGSMVSQDVPPYCMCQGDRAKLVGLNQVGLRRFGIEQRSYFKLREAFRRLFWNRTSLAKAMDDVEQTFGEDPFVRRVIAFMRESPRGICPARRPVREGRLLEDLP
jgi:UDP-N-acetylglucosamine acyltransferase